MLLQANDICKSYGTKTVLSNICLQINEGERIGLVGANGAGKSTLLQILSRHHSKDSGEIHKSKETSIGYLAQNSGLDSNQNIWDEMLSVFADLIQAEQKIRQLEREMSDPNQDHDSGSYKLILERYDQQSEWFRKQGGYELETKIKSVLHGMGFTNDPRLVNIHTLSGGQKTRLALAKLLLQSPDILMLDEPTNHLDIPTLTWLEGYLKTYPGGMIVISHDRYFLDAVTDVTYEIERTEAKRYTGNYSRFIELKEAEYEIQLKHYEKQKNEISKMEDFVQRNLARASTTKRAQSRRKALERMDKMDNPLGELKRAYFRFEVEKATGKDVLTASDLAMSFHSETMLFKNVHLILKRGESVALIGPNGIGKSTLLKLIIGQQKQIHGKIHWGTNVKIGYYDQDQSALTETNTIIDEVWNDFPSIEEARIRTILGNFLFSGEDVSKKISALSGGEKARVSLAKLMLLQANVLILDEPTNHLDINSKEVLEASLLDYEGTLLFISHDRYFLNKMAERIIELTADGTTNFLGDYTDYVAKKQEWIEMKAEIDVMNQQKATTQESSVESISSYEVEKRAKQDERNKQRRTEKLESDIASVELEISALEEQLTQPEVYDNFTIVQEKNDLIEQKKTTLKQYYDEWESLLT